MDSNQEDHPNNQLIRSGVGPVVPGHVPFHIPHSPHPGMPRLPRGQGFLPNNTAGKPGGQGFPPVSFGFPPQPPLPPADPWPRSLGPDYFYRDGHWTREYNDRTTSRRRDRPVEVMMRNGGLFHCNREDILHHLPNVNNYPLGRQFRPEGYIQPPNQCAPETHAALVALFKGLEIYRNTGLPLELFENMDDLLDKAMDGRQGFREAARFFCGVCQALDKEKGLGCSDELLQQIDDFVLGLMESVDVEISNPGNLLCGTVVRDIVVCYSKVFQPSSASHMDALRQLWMLIPPVLKRNMMTEILQLSDQGSLATSNAQVFSRALRDMSVF